MKRLMVITLAIMTLVPVAASARVFVGIRPAFGFGYVYRPYWGMPYWGPGPYYGLYPVAVPPSTGAVKFETKEKSAKVYVDDGFVGTVSEVKTLHLSPGTHEIQVTEPGRTSFDEEVYVAAGNTIKLHPDLQPLGAEGTAAGD